MGEHGLVIYNLVSVKVVVVRDLTTLPDKQVVRAGRDINKKLFWALRGAGASLGIVTSFTYEACEQKNEVWSGLLIFKINQLEPLIKFANSYIMVRPPGSRMPQIFLDIAR